MLTFLRLSALLFVLSTTYTTAQEKTTTHYFAADDLTLVGKIMPTEHPFHRIDTTKANRLPQHIKNLVAHSAGIAIAFTTNSTAIYAKWCTNKAVGLQNMTDIAVRGLDLYRKENGRWQFVGVGKPKAGQACASDQLINHMKASGQQEYLLYLPTYSTLESLEIGITEGASLHPGKQPFTKDILIYGSSIVQGASASRPGMAYPALLTRNTGYNFLNLGMSGSAKMEKEVADVVAGIPAEAYILDCVPNTSPEEITERAAYLMQAIRENNPKAPIIVIQSVIRESSYFDEKVAERVQKQNKNILEEFTKVQQTGMQNIHFIYANDLLGQDHEGTTDGTHPNDLGFHRMIQALQPQLLKIIENQ